MKLRVRHNSIRFRLQKQDVQTLRSSGECREAILFPGGGRLEYSLRVSDSHEVGVRFSGGVVSISMPAGRLTAWHSSNQVGISAAVPVDSDKMLDILIEKDFRCLDEGIHEDQSDTFDNPLTVHANCPAQEPLRG